MELRDLSYFVAVAEEASFTRGARRVYVVQSAVSAAVARLERQLGVSLFDRTPGALALTDSGRVLLFGAQRLLAESRRLSHELQAMAGRHHGVVELSTVLSTGTFDLDGALAEFRREHPSVSVHLSLSAGPVDDLLEDLSRSQTQLMLVPRPRRHHPQIQLDPVGEVHQVLACRTDHPLAASREVTILALAEQSFIDFPATWGNRAQTDALFSAVGIEKDVAVEVQDVPRATSLVQSGVGIAFLPGEELLHHDDLTEIHLQTPPEHVDLVLAVGTDRPAPPATTALHTALLGWASRANG